MNTADPRPAGAGRPPHVLLAFQPVVAGVPHVVADLGEGLVSRGWRISVAGPSNTPVRKRLESVAENYLIFDLSNGPKPRSDLRAYRAISRLCGSSDIDLVHAHSSKAGAICAVLARVSDARCIYSPHAWSFQRELSRAERQVWMTVERVVANQHAGIVVNCAAERDAARAVGITTPIETVSHGLRDVDSSDRASARERLGLPRELFTVGWVGRDAPQKRPEHLTTIARGLGSRASIVALGFGMPASPAGMELAAAGAIVFPGRDPSDVYSAIDVLAVTSRWEGSPLTTLEAMRAGRAVVAYDVGGLAEQIEDGKTGFLIRSGDVRQMIGRLAQLSADPALTAEMGDAGRRMFESRFTLDRMLAGSERVYRHHLGVTETAW